MGSIPSGCPGCNTKTLRQTPTGLQFRVVSLFPSCPVGCPFFGGEGKGFPLKSTTQKSMPFFSYCWASEVLKEGNICGIKGCIHFCVTRESHLWGLVFGTEVVISTVGKIASTSFFLGQTPFKVNYQTKGIPIPHGHQLDPVATLSVFLHMASTTRLRSIQSSFRFLVFLHPPRRCGVS